MWRVKAVILAFLTGLVVWHGAAIALEAESDMAGIWNGTVLRLRLVEMDETSLRGEIDQTWLDAAGHRQEGKAGFVGSRDGNAFEIFLMPTSFVTLPIRLNGRLSESKVVLHGEGTAGYGSDVQLIRAGAAEYDALISKLAAVPMGDVLSSAPVNFSPADARLEMQGDMEEGCQCGPEKKTHVAEVTLQLVTEVARHAAALNDYLRGLNASWREVKASLREARAASWRTEAVVLQNLEQRDYTRRLLLGRNSIATYDDVFGAFRDAQLHELTGLQHQCQQRNLPISAAVTAEEKIWANSCTWVERIHHAYVAPGDNFGDIISLARSPALYVVSR